MSSKHAAIHGFDALKIGLSFMPVVVGSGLATFTAGRATNWNFNRHAHKLGLSPAQIRSRGRDLGDFPIKQVRCQVTTPILVLASVSRSTYGGVLDHQTYLIGPVVMFFIVGCCADGFATILSVLVVDIYPHYLGTATAVANLVRRWLGVGASVLIIPMINAMSSRWACQLIAFIYWLLLPMLLNVMGRGAKCRAARVASETPK